MTSKATRRETLAFIALADAPMPLGVSFKWGNSPAISLAFDSSRDAMTWAAIFGVDLTLTGACYYRFEWRGLALWFAVPEGDAGQTDQLDDATATQLRAVSLALQPHPDDDAELQVQLATDREGR